MRVFNRASLLASSLLTGAGLSLAASVAAVAQQEAPEDTIVVTGTRIPQANLLTTSPVTQVTSSDITSFGVSRVEDLINELPQAFAAQDATVSNGATGTATVDLRGLGPSRTLVLIDGRRMPYGSPSGANDPEDGAGADLNSIPAQLVERVEVLTGGASAVYGSDAVAGVVNFIMRSDFEGIELDAQYGFFQHNNDYDTNGDLRSEIIERSLGNPREFRLPEDNVKDGESLQIAAIMGVSTDDDRGNLTAYATYRDTNHILQAERDYSACAADIDLDATSPTFGQFLCGGSGTAFPGTFTDFETFEFTIDQETGEFRDFTFDDQYNFGPLNFYQRPDERYTFGAFGRYQIVEKVEAYTQLMFSDYQSVAQVAPSGTFFETETINCDNPLLSPTQAADIGCTPDDIASGATTPLFIGRRNVEGGGRQDDFSFETFRGVIGIRGDLDEAWSYDLYGQFSRVRMTDVFLNDFSIVRLGRALNVVTDPETGEPVCASVLDGTDENCVPYDIFSVGGVTQEALDYLQIPLIQVGQTEQQVVNLSLTGDLGVYGLTSPYTSRGVQVALGIEYRQDSLESVTDVAFATGDGAGQGGPTIGLEGSVDSTDLFFEIEAPLIEGAPFAELLSIDAAYRYSDYGRFTTDTYKFGAEWAPVSDIRLRGSYQRAVRAPNVIELFQAQGFNLFDADFDPCDAVNRPAEEGPVPASCIGTEPWQVTPAQSASGALDSPAGQYNFLQGGEPDLAPEEVDTYTIGVVFTPATFLSGLTASIDYFNIDLSDRIDNIDPLVTLTACYEEGDLASCERIMRNPNGQLWVGDGNVVALNTNIGGLSTSGIDVVADYVIDIGENGSVALNFVGTWLDELETDPGLGEFAIFDCVGFYGNECETPRPEWRHRAQATWSMPWSAEATLGWRYYGEVELFGNTVTQRVDAELDAQHYFDLSGTWRPIDGTELRAGVNNILDEDPPLSASVGVIGNGNTYPQTYDAFGRFFFFGVTQSF